MKKGNIFPNITERLEQAGKSNKAIVEVLGRSWTGLKDLKQNYWRWKYWIGGK